MLWGMNDLHPNHHVLDAIGALRLRQRLDVKGPRIANWRRRGIPPQFLMPVKSLADELGHAVPGDFLAPLGMPAEGQAA